MLVISTEYKIKNGLVKHRGAKRSIGKAQMRGRQYKVISPNGTHFGSKKKASAFESRSDEHFKN